MKNSVGRISIVGARRPPTGIVTLMLVVGLVLMVALLAWTINTAWTWYAYQQLQTACDAAALAGTGRLMETVPIEPHDDLATVDGTDVLDALHDERALRMAAARIEAVYFASQNRVAGEPLTLDANPENDPDGDVVVGWMDEPTGLGAAMIPIAHAGRANSVLVRGRLTQGTKNPLTLWLGHWLGLSCIDVVASAQAVVDQRLYGFQPAGHIRVPLVPLLVTVPHDHVTWPGIARADEHGDGEDRFSVDARTAEIRPGADGIDEIRLRLRASSEQERTNGASWRESRVRFVDYVLALHGLPVDRERLAIQIHAGLGDDDLSRLGGRFIPGVASAIPVSARRISDSGLLAVLREALWETRGQKRIWPLGIVRGEGNATDQSCQILGFAAGQVVDGVDGDAGTFELVIQPCWLQTPTALVGAGNPHNPWIGKLVLVR